MHTTGDQRGGEVHLREDRDFRSNQHRAHRRQEVGTAVVVVILEARENGAGRM